MNDRIRALFCRHQGAIHLCQPPNGNPSLVICQKCDVVMARYGEPRPIGGHRFEGDHDCFLANCADLGREVEVLREKLNRLLEAER